MIEGNGETGILETKSRSTHHIHAKVICDTHVRERYIYIIIYGDVKARDKKHIIYIAY